jgi:hypothetical protein
MGILNLRKMVSDNKSSGIAVREERVTDNPINETDPPISSKNKNKKFPEPNCMIPVNALNS